ncbi:unnamed protein product, partial [Iphiclides podalirius]
MFTSTAIHEPIFLTTRFGNPLMIIDNYRFNKRSDSKGPQINWVCVKKDRQCRATVTTFDNTILKYRNYHNH